MSDRPPKSRWRRALLLQLVLWPVLLLSAELGYRGLRRVQGDPYSGWDTRRELLRAQSSMTDLIPDPDAKASPVTNDSVELHPYAGYAPAVLLEHLERHRATPDTDERTTVVFVGGSVCGLFSDHAGETFVARLAEELGRAPDTVRQLNYAVGGYKQPQQVAMLTQLLVLGLECDAVVNLDGFNEVALANHNAVRDVHPAYPSMMHWGHASLRSAVGTGDAESELSRLQDEVRGVVERTLAWGLERSALVGTVQLRRVRSIWSRYGLTARGYEEELALRMHPEMRGPEFDRTAVVDTLVGTWERSSRLLDDLCDARGIAYVHALQPTLHDEGSKPLTPKELENAGARPEWIEGVRLGYPRLREAGARLAAGGIAFVDLSRLFVDVEETLYYDNCHVGPAGSVAMVDPLVEAVARELRR